MGILKVTFYSDFINCVLVIFYMCNNSASITKQMLEMLHVSNQHSIISGPLGALLYGDIKFSRICKCQLWLKHYWCAWGLPFVDNFLAFLGCEGVFSGHPNRAGASPSDHEP